MDMHEQPTTPWTGGELPTDQASTQYIEPVSTVNKARPAGGISRRKLFFGLAGAGVAVAGGGVALAELAQHGKLGPLNSLFPHSTTSTTTQANGQIGHLLRRAGFGASSAELASYSALGYNGAVDRLINYQQVPDDAMEQAIKALNLDMTKVQGQQQWWLLRMAWTQRPLLEKMTLFWHGYLTSSYTKVGGPQAYGRLINQNNFLRSHAFDTFDNILLGITSDPAMLVYLDLNASTKTAPNENYARELMELFTLGIGHYTQQDVFEGAAALSGWHVIGKTDQSHYVERTHNDATKNYLGQTGNFDYKDVIRILANHPATPWNLSRRLFSFFGYENPSNTDLQPLVDSYVKSNHNMGEVMRTLLLSPQFNSQKAYRSRVKSPTEFVVGVYRSLGIKGSGKMLPLQNAVIGQLLFNPPNVAGWPGDKISSAWLNSGTWMARLNYVNLLLLGNSRNATANGIDLQAIVNDNHLDTPEHFVDHFTSFLLDGNLDQDRKTNLVNYFKSPESTVATVSTIQKVSKASTAKITLTNGTSYPLSRVRGTVYLIMSLPEYQLN